MQNCGLKEGGCPQKQESPPPPTMASGHTTLNLEDELNCPLCLQLFSDPVILDCGHDFCRLCILKFWDNQNRETCPECGQVFQDKTLKSNRALGKLVKKSRNHTLNLKLKGTKPYCIEHEEELKLFCETDRKLICVMCLDRRDGRSHKAHNFMLINEAVEIYKEKMRVSLNNLKQKKSYYQDFEVKQQEKITEIKDQSSKLQTHITSEFTKMRSVLEEKQQNMFTDLSTQESEVLSKMEINLRKIQDNLNRTQHVLSNVQKRLDYQDIYTMLKEPPLDEKSAEDDYQPTITEGNLPIGVFQGPVQYRVWKQVIDVIIPDYKYAGCSEPASNPTSRTDASEDTPRKRSIIYSTEEHNRKSPKSLTLNANTAHPRLVLSEDLTVVTYGDVKQEVKEMPERFDTCVCVLGSEGFTSGKHYWEVQVGSKTEWDLGVVKESISRKGHTTATPETGYWIVWLRNGTEYKATTVPRTRLTVPRKPRAIGVYLDYEGGQVSFYNVDNMSHLYTFIDTFSERLFSYFSPGINDDGENSEPLRILPIKCHDE
ncbi:zinc-binding protein A33-like isoform X1 [Scyliorhinus canicula]|uniref:zinc-binding protein A33-like isoform X1 n=1 Tax=Scyliorhinus canicula TaxID=7830 RepID=UPI0018F45CED|nr:zinc-binding protein A33-like isoform X1 [Scyliorhinus canicula]XP_038673053.1 zinc-binding protein A33-like isoform X1 [Scyliorhinus canicula]XP_038673054.1 zinc-binding protein A33-like isoform X1 [Scyliorhinus canicula]XP_038673055.1 zinc-binding protein A33-like isoform X1 [Scyliorhinus canicula]